MKNEIAITRRATYKAEEAVQKLEQEKSQQDALIDKLQESLKSLHQAATLRAAQVPLHAAHATMCARRCRNDQELHATKSWL